MPVKNKPTKQRPTGTPTSTQATVVRRPAKTAEERALDARAHDLARRAAEQQQAGYELEAKIQQSFVQFLTREREQAQVGLEAAVRCITNPGRCMPRNSDGSRKVPWLNIAKILVERAGDALDTAIDIAGLENDINGHAAKQLRLAQEWQSLKNDQERYYRNRGPSSPPPKPPPPIPAVLREATPEELEQWRDDVYLWCWEGIGGEGGQGDRCFDGEPEAFKRFAEKHPEIVGRTEATYRAPDSGTPDLNACEAEFEAISKAAVACNNRSLDCLLGCGKRFQNDPDIWSRNQIACNESCPKCEKEQAAFDRVIGKPCR